MSMSGTGQLELYGAPLGWLWVGGIAMALATPALIRGFLRRGRGIRYESCWLTQRAPQIAIGLNLLVLVLAFEAIELVLGTGEPSFGGSIFEAARDFLPLVSLALVLPGVLAGVIAWAGLGVATFGLVFLVGGWHSLGESFSPDAEVFAHHELQTGRFFRFVMHPVYTGIFFFLLGSAILTSSLPAGLLTLGLVAPLLLRRAKYEEDLLEGRFGPAYREFAKSRRWRRLVPTFFPIGL
jgi:protein-S-isoprenylcysteine O-methyltransferase Ste14